MSKRLGALPRQVIRDMIHGGFVQNASEENLQPSSLDLGISDEGEIYRVSSTFTPRTGEPVIEAAKRLADIEPYDIKLPLELDVTYLVRLNETLVLPSSVYAYANPKSTSGRNDVHVRMLADGMQRFDSAGMRGYKGSLWALVTPHSFRVKIHPRDTLLQMRFFNGDTRFSREEEIEIAYQQHQLLFDEGGEFIEYSRIKIRDQDGSIILTVNLSADLVGYRCEKKHNVLDFARKDHDPEEFFTPIHRPKNGRLRLRKGDFYIFFTKECPRVPPLFAAEMRPVDVRAGEYRSHYAGYIDPGWGHGRDGSVKGQPLVLEMRPHEDDLTLEDGKAVCKLDYERMTEEPDLVYGEGGLGSHYFRQFGPRLSKHFLQQIS